MVLVLCKFKQLMFHQEERREGKERPSKYYFSTGNSVQWKYYQKARKGLASSFYNCELAYTGRRLHVHKR